MEKMRNKDGKVVSYREKVYVEGKAITKTFKRKSDALSWRRNFLLELQRRQALGIDHIESTDFESFSGEWLKMKQNQNMARRTVESYGSVVRIYLQPCLGKIRLERINARHANKVIQAGIKNGISPRRINFNLAVLKQILGDAVRLNHLVQNPLAGFKKLKERQRSLTYWMPEQVTQFLSSNMDDPNYPTYVLALNTGLRRGELLGLCWDKVDLHGRKVEIARSRDRYGLKNTTKTGAIRYVPLNGVALRVLGELEKDKCHERFVFAYQDGSLPDVVHTYRTFKKAVERARVPQIRFHELRTTYASNFVMAGGDVFALSKILGHTSVEMTAKRYAALHPSFMKDVAQTVQFEGRCG